MVSIVKRPDKFSPVQNNLIWQIKSSNAGLVYFRVELLDVDTSTLIGQLDCYLEPGRNSSYVDLSRLMDITVSWEILNDSTKLVAPLFKTVRAYRLKITERIFNNLTSTIEDGAVYDDATDVSYVFNARLSRLSAHNYTQVKYVVGPNNVASFLTSKPNYGKVNDISAEMLYFLQDGTVPGLKARIRTFDASGSLVATKLATIPDLNTYKMYRLNVSPKSLMDSSNINFAGVAYYVVDLVDATLQQRSEERVYVYGKVPCHLDFVNLLWVNSLGGIDAYQWVAPADTININRFLLKTSTTRVDSDGLYSDSNNGIYNASEVIINNDVTTVTKVTSKELSDAEAYWLQELFASKQIFAETTTGELVPALLNNTTYQIPRLKYMRGQMNVIQIEFTLAAGVIPSGVSAYSSRTSSIEFINSQMNALVVNLPGYGVIVNGTTGSYQKPNYGHDYN